MTNRPAYKIIYFVVMFLLSLIVFREFVRTHINGFFPAMFGDMVYGKAFKPYVYRTLIPSTIRIATFSIPSNLKAFLDKSVERSGILNTNKQIDSPCQSCHESILKNKSYNGKLRGVKMNLPKIFLWEKEYLTEYAIALVLMYFSLLAFLWAIKYLFTGLYDVGGVPADMTPLISLMGLPFFFKYYSYLYDFTNLFLFTLALGLMVREKWRLYSITFILACLNKETAILLTIIFAMNFYKHIIMLPPFKGLLIAQLGIFTIIKIGLYIIFKSNPGDFMLFSFFEHNLQIFKLHSFTTIFIMAIISCIATAIFLKRFELTSFLRRGLLIMIPHFFFIILFGFVEEWRVYYEIYPIIVLSIFHILGSFMGIKLTKSVNSLKMFPGIPENFY